MVRKRPSMLVAVLVIAFALGLTPAANAASMAGEAIAASQDKCGGLFVGQIVAKNGVQRLTQCGFTYSGNPIEVSALDLGVSVPPPLVFVTVIALVGFPPKPTVAACAGLLRCRAKGSYSPKGPLGSNLHCIFGAVSVKVTVEVLYRFKCSSGDRGLPLPLSLPLPRAA
jgi:hypothetical protein